MHRVAREKSCQMQFRRQSRAGTPRERSRPVWRRARAGVRKCRSHCPRDARDSPRTPSPQGRNRWQATRSACRPPPTARHVAPARCRPPGTRNLARRELAIVALVAFDIRRLDVVECEVAAFLITQFGHSLEKIGIDRCLPTLNADKPDMQHLRLLLRARHHRPHDRRTADQRDELAPSHSITSSARATSVGGTSKPKALAVFRLTTNSNLVPCCTGRSAGFAPLMILSTKLAERYHMSLMLAEYENRQPASAISRTPQISGRRWRAAAAAIAAREAMKVASSSTKTASAGHARIDAKLGSKSSNPCTCKTR